MGLRKGLVSLFLVLIVLTLNLSSFSAAIISPSDLDTCLVPESHLIEGVPYVKQEISCSCLYACCTIQQLLQNIVQLPLHR